MQALANPESWVPVEAPRKKPAMRQRQVCDSATKLPTWRSPSLTQERAPVVRGQISAFFVRRWPPRRMVGTTRRQGPHRARHQHDHAVGQVSPIAFVHVVEFRSRSQVVEQCVVERNRERFEPVLAIVIDRRCQVGSRQIQAPENLQQEEHGIVEGVDRIVFFSRRCGQPAGVDDEEPCPAPIGRWPFAVAAAGVEIGGGLLLQGREVDVGAEKAAAWGMR